jgi:hypothetical protein
MHWRIELSGLEYEDTEKPPGDCRAFSDSQWRKSIGAGDHGAAGLL